jgi:hypothetical protein
VIGGFCRRTAHIGKKNRERPIFVYAKSSSGLMREQYPPACSLQEHFCVLTQLQHLPINNLYHVGSFPIFIAVEICGWCDCVAAFLP